MIKSLAMYDTLVLENSACWCHYAQDLISLGLEILLNFVFCFSWNVDHLWYLIVCLGLHFHDWHYFVNILNPEDFTHRKITLVHNMSCLETKKNSLQNYNFWREKSSVLKSVFRFSLFLYYLFLTSTTFSLIKPKKPTSFVYFHSIIWTCQGTIYVP